MKITSEASPYGDQVHHFIGGTDTKFSVSIDITGNPTKAKRFADALKKCLQSLVKEDK
jgi:hypothetical protein